MYREGFAGTFHARENHQQLQAAGARRRRRTGDRQHAGIILNQAGFEARAVYSGEKAIEALDTFHPDMLISDVIMTGMTGIEAAIQTRSKLPKCKILLFSGQAATADLLERARSQGHEFEILAKPVHPTDLLAKLRG